MSDGETPRPALRVVRGNPSPEELAALTALVAVSGGTDEAPAAPPRGGWSDPARTFRQPLRPGPGAWRSSGW